MKLSSKTIEILSNFSTIDNSMTFKPGKKQVVWSKNTNVLGNVVLEENFPVEFSIYDLNSFLKNLKLVGSPEMTFLPEKVVLKSEKMEIDYYFSAANVVKYPPASDLPLDNPDFAFVLKSEQFSSILKIASVNNLTHLKFSYNKKENSFVATIHDMKGARPNSGKVLIKSTEIFDILPKDESFEAIFLVENLLKLMSDLDFEVSILNNRYARFTNLQNNINYYIACELVNKNSVTSKNNTNEQNDDEEDLSEDFTFDENKDE